MDREAQIGIFIKNR